ncbi:MAG: ribulokinase [Clostridia bacterium]|nr:ribulokinase [Clostridia bacterium]
MQKRYSIGVDFGTLSGRAVLYDLSTGNSLASAVMDYPHGVMDRELPDGTPLPADFALQYPKDYLEVLSTILPKVIASAGVDPREVIGLGLDFTTCTLIPVTAEGTPLCFLPEYQNNPHAFPKLWKHHSPEEDAQRATRIAKERGESFLSRYGGKISTEWLLPKMMETLRLAPEIYHTAAYFVEAMDFMVWQLTGRLTRSASAMGYKALWHKREGFPSKDFLTQLDPDLANLYDEKLAGPILTPGSLAGTITPEAAERFGLAPGTAVAVGMPDAHVAASALRVTSPGTLFCLLGTSGCHMLLGDREISVPGICGFVEDGIMPGFYGYEAGQSCFGDLFGWFVDHQVPAAYQAEADENKLSIHALLTQKAAALSPGESGLLALDWWNGNRSILVDFDLSGMILGMTLLTRPEEIYRALLESACFGTRMIVENYKSHGVPVNEIIACGGIAKKNPLLMQILSDVLGLPVKLAASDQATAQGSAICGAVAAGSKNGGFDTLEEGALAMGRLSDLVYQPKAENTAIYNQLYKEYATLHDYFGRGENNVMKRLRALSREGWRP